MVSNKKNVRSVKVVLAVICVGLTTLTKAHWVWDDANCRTPRGIGVCVLIQNCKPILDFISQAQTLSQHAIETLRRDYQCGYDENQVKVCCPDGPIMIGNRNSLPPPDVSTNQNINLLPVDCTAGVCVFIRNCKPILDFISQAPTLSQSAIETLRVYQCGNEENQVKVCCPDEPIVIGNRNNLPPPDVPPPPDVSTDRNINPLPVDCRAGVCVSIRSCKPILDFISQAPTLSQSAIETLRVYQCGNEENQVKVCCPDKLIVIGNRDSLPPADVPPPADVSTDPNINPLPVDCRAGVCVSIRNCKPILDFISQSQPHSQGTIETLRGYQCGNEENQVKVCCPDEPIVIGNRDNLPPPDVPPPPDVSTERNINPLPVDCRAGVCVSIRNCKPILDFISQAPTLSQSAIETLKVYQCGNEENQVKVCCPDEPIVIGNRDSLPPPDVPPPADVSTDPNINPLPVDCRAGECVSIRNCKPILDFISQSQPLSQGSIETLRGYQCGNEENQVKVCCPDGPIVMGNRDNLPPPDAPSPSDVPPPPDVSTDPNINPPPVDCRAGECVSIRNCKPILDFISQAPALSQSAIETLRVYQCGNEENPVKVCCPDEPIVIGNRDSLPPADVPPPADVSTDPNINPLPVDCRAGECVSIRNCKPILDFISQSQPLSQGAIETLKGYQCGNEENQVKVCCPDGPIVIGNRDSLPSPDVPPPPDVTPSPNVSTDSNINLLPVDCKAGVCVSIRNCKPILDFISQSQPLSQGAIETLKGYQCGNEENQVKVCCPDGPIVIGNRDNLPSPDVPPPSDVTPSPNVSTDSNINPLPVDCKAGVCVSIRNCKPILDFISQSQPLSQGAIKTLRGYQCGNEENQVKVCCPDGPIVIGNRNNLPPPEVPSPSDVSPPADVSTDPNINPLPVDCRAGVCVSIRNCKPILDFISQSQPLSQGAIETLKGYQCGNEENQVEVCCPDGPIVIGNRDNLPSPDVPPPSDVTPSPNVSTDSNINPLPVDCKAVVCVSIRNCKPILDFISQSQPLSQGAIETLRGYQCGNEENQVKVCCPDGPIVIGNRNNLPPPEVPSPSDVSPPADVSTDPNINPLPVDCRAGVCVSIRNCKPILDFISQPQPLSQGAIETLRGYQCGNEENQVKVCCPDGPIVIGNRDNLPPPDVPSPSDVPPPADVSTDPNINPVPVDCRAGMCVFIRNCKPILDFISQPQPLSQGAIETLRGYQCGNEENQVKVCCPDGPIVIGNRDNLPSPDVPPPSDVTPSPNVSTDSNINPLPVDCKAGVCVSIRNCKPILDFISQSQPLSQGAVETLRGYQCGNEENQVNVCCPDGPIVVIGNRDSILPTDVPPSSDVPPPPDVSTHRNINLLPVDCGQLPEVYRIIGGNKTALFEFPWMALLSYETGNGRDFRCGCSIISDRYILTAAHCITNLSTLKLLGVRAGEYDIDSPTDCEQDGPGGQQACAPPVQDVAIERAIPHPRYNPTTYADDIGLIRLATPLNTTVDSVKPICLPSTSYLRSLNFSNTKFLVTGWGATETGKKSSALLKVEVPVISEDNCRKAYENSSTTINYKQLCAGGRDKSDSCGGDSGGPLQRAENFNDDARFVQFGIVSFGPRFCGQDGIPGIYTRIDYYMDWILDNMES